MRISRFKALLMLSVVFVLFQNFTLSETNQKALFPKIHIGKAYAPQTADDNAMLVIQEMNHWKPNTTETSLVTPNQGRDLNSVTSSWAQRQGAVWLNGANKRLIASINETLDSWTPEESHQENSGDPSSVLNQPVARSLRFNQINSVEYGLKNKAKVTMRIEGDGGHLDYSQRIDEKTKLGIEHKSAENKTQFLLKYDW